MVTRRRIQTRTPSEVGGGGEVTPGTAVVRMGPDFGEGSGNDDTTFTEGQTLDSPFTLAMLNETTENEALGFTRADFIFNEVTEEEHLSGTYRGAPNWRAVAFDENDPAAGASNLVITKPAGTVQGDLLVAFLAAADAADEPDIVPGIAGWTTIRTDLLNLVGGGAVNMSVRSFYRIAGASEPASYTFNSNAGPMDTIMGEIHRIEAIDSTTPIDAHAGATHLANTLDPDPSAPAVTTNVTNTLIFAFMFHAHLALNQTHTPPGSHIERTDFEDASTPFYSVTSATRVFATAGSQAAVEFNCTETVATDAVLQRVAVAPGDLVIAT